MKLTENFSLPEFQSKDGSAFPAEVVQNLKVLSKQLEVLRAHFGKPITVTSGYRSPAHNLRIGGEKNSFHVKGMAADIKVEGVNPYTVGKQIEMLIDAGKMLQGGIGIYPTFTHYDIRQKRIRWDKTKSK